MCSSGKENVTPQEGVWCKQEAQVHRELDTGQGRECPGDLLDNTRLLVTSIARRASVTLHEPIVIHQHELQPCWISCFPCGPPVPGPHPGPHSPSFIFMIPEVPLAATVSQTCLVFNDLDSFKYLIECSLECPLIRICLMSSWPDGVVCFWEKGHRD